MHRTLRIVALLLLVLGAALGAVVAARGPGEKPLAPVPADPSRATLEILHAQAFRLDEPYVHEWRAEKPAVTAGIVLVLRTDPELARPRQTYEPVLYVGSQTAERINAPENGANLIVLVPAEMDAHGAVALDLAATPIWFGTPELPERVGAATIARELALALASGAGPAAMSGRMKARPVSAEMIHVRDRSELELVLADLIELFSPEERDLAAGLRVPVIR